MNDKADKKEIRNDLRKVSAIYALSTSEGGMILLDSLLADIVSSIDTIAGSYEHMSHVQLIAASARLKERLDLFKVMKKSKANREIIEQALKNALEEDPDEQ